MRKKYTTFTPEMIAENRRLRTLYPDTTPVLGDEYITFTPEMIAENNKLRTITQEMIDENRRMRTLHPGGRQNQNWQDGPVSRAQLKAGLRDALMNVGVMTMARDGDEEIKDTLYVLNMDTPPPSSNKLKAEINSLIQEIITYDSQVAEKFTNKIVNSLWPGAITKKATKDHHLPDVSATQDIRQVLREGRTFSEDINIDRIDLINSSVDAYSESPGYMLRVDEPTCDKSNLLHPEWYFGFWNDSIIRFNGIKLLGSDATVKFTFYSNNYLSTSLRYRITQNGPADHTISLSDYSSDYPDSSQGSFTQFNEIGENKNDPASGWLIVWNANIWKCQYLTRMDVAESQTERYMNPDLFDHIKIEVFGVDIDFGFVEVILNGVLIFERTYNQGHSLSEGGRLILDVQDYRHNSLLFENDYDARPATRGYRKKDIIESSFLRSISHQLGQSWNPKYCMTAKWRENKDTGEWYTAPDWWCAESATYYIKKAMPNFKPSNLREGVGIGKMTKWFIENDLYIGPNQKGDNRFSYSQLGDKVKPGYFFSIRNGYHGAFFLYWIRPETLVLFLDPHGFVFFESFCRSYNTEFFDLGSLSDLNRVIISEFINELDAPSNNPSPQPGNFNPTAPINYFLAINGNAGGRFRLDVYAIINFDGVAINPTCLKYLFIREFSTLILKGKLPFPFPFGQSGFFPQAMIWSGDRPYDYKGTYPIEDDIFYEDGFGIIKSDRIPRVEGITH